MKDIDEFIEESIQDDKEVRIKIWVLFGIILCVVTIAFYVGAAGYGYNKGINTAKEYYTGYYIPEFCKCIEPSESYSVDDWLTNDLDSLLLLNITFD